MPCARRRPIRRQLTIRCAQICLLALIVTQSSSAFCKRPFTPEDDIGLTLLSYDEGGMIKYAPDGAHFVAVTGRGRLRLYLPGGPSLFFFPDEVWGFLGNPDN